MRLTSDMIIGGGLVLALLISLVIPLFGVDVDNSKLQDTIAIGLVGFMGKAAFGVHDEKKEKKGEGEKQNERGITS